MSYVTVVLGQKAEEFFINFLKHLKIKQIF